MSGNLKFHLSALSNSRTVGASVDDSIDSVATWNVSWRNAVVEGKREAAREQHYLVLFGPSTGNPSLFGPSYVRRALLCFSSYIYLVVMMKIPTAFLQGPVTTSIGAKTRSKKHF